MLEFRVEGSGFTGWDMDSSDLRHRLLRTLGVGALRISSFRI